MGFWPFRKKADSSKHGVSDEVEEEADRRLSRVEAPQQISLEWDDDEDNTEIVRLACVEAQESSSAASETLTRSTRLLRQDVRTTYAMVTGSQEAIPLESLRKLAEQAEVKKASEG